MAVTITFLIVTTVCFTFTVWIITVFTGAGHDFLFSNAIARACLRLVTFLPELDLSFLVLNSFITFAILFLDKICS